ncbi:hypothetical protein CspHIS471_0400230 [Cutaneotrichosporon sp. HIS471]|nr:hypothetical protein CspHIS471_0400230 [Cutaneotrichosporon sp. HIS471]
MSRRDDGPPPAKKAALDIAAIRAQVAARKAAIEGRSGSATPAAGSRGTSGSNSPAPPPSSSSTAPAKPAPKVDPNIRDRIAAARARVEARNAEMNSRQAGPAAPAAPLPKPKPTGIALHPLLMADTVEATQEKNEKRAMRDRYKTMAPKFSTVRANAAAVEEAAAKAAKAAPTPISISNPYISTPTAGIGPEEQGAGPGPARARKSRKMAFSAPGKYIKQGEQLRNDIKLEELKARIAAQSRKAGLDSEFDVLERSLKRQAPPAVEWWDEAIMPSGTGYDDLPKALEYIDTNNESLVTHLVQHPIAITAAGDRRQPERGLMLTKKEQKKMRRQRRMAELKDRQDRVRMGLIPPDPPKVRLANMMKVLTSDAVQDPTKLEKRIVREVELRALKHEQDNAERKLSKDDRREKDYAKLAEAETKNGLQASVYLIRYLTNGRHKFKVRKTAEHDLLTGLTIFAPNFALVVVEGVAKKIKHYRQLMTSRIDWTEEPRALGEDSGSEEEEGDDEKKDGPDMSTNRCEVVWEGEIPERTFKFFRARHAETDSEGKNFLGSKYEGLWDLAKRWNWDEDVY